VVDASHPGLDDQVAAVEALLGELDLSGRPRVVALNKLDRLESAEGLERLAARLGGVPVSARTGQGLPALLDRIHQALAPGVGRAELRIPYTDGAALGLCYQRGRVRWRRDEPEGIRLEVDLPRPLLGAVEAYRVRA